MDGSKAGAPIVVGVDGSQRAIEAAQWAARLARSVHVPLILAHVTGAPGEHRRRPIDCADPRQRMRYRSLRSMVRQVRALAPDVEVQTEILHGRPDTRLLELSRHARMLVVGAVPVAGTALLGPTTMRVATRAACPVLVWRTPVARAQHAGPVVVGVRGRQDEAAVRAGFEMAAALGAAIHVVHAYPPGLAPLGPGHDYAREERDHLTGLVGAWSVQHPGVPVVTRSVPGNPVPVLTAAAANARLLVVGSRGRGTAAAVLLGSVSRDLVHRAACSVLVCRNDIEEADTATSQRNGLGDRHAKAAGTSS